MRTYTYVNFDVLRQRIFSLISAFIHVMKNQSKSSDKHT